MYPGDTIVLGIVFGIIGVICLPWVFGPSSTAPHRWLARFPVPVVIIIIVMLVGNARYERK